MHIKYLLPLAGFLIIFLNVCEINGQVGASMEPLFELPVQLVGFPVIIAAVKLSNFVKKLGYSLTPQTYATRSRRDLGNLESLAASSEVSDKAIDIAIAEKAIIKELGDKACVLEEPCKIHAARKAKIGAQPEWSDILSNYKVQSTGMKQWYLLSVFLGDVIRDIPLCKQLAKRLDCNRHVKEIIRD